MKREGREIERKIDEAIRTAAGASLGRGTGSRVEAALGRSGGVGVPAWGTAEILAALDSLPRGASGTAPGAGTAETTGVKSTASMWSNVLPAAISGLLAQESNTGRSNWQRLLSNLNPIFGGVLRIFGGGSGESPRQLPITVRPVTARYELGVEGGEGGYYFVDRDASGAPRGARPIAAPPVVVQVEAMDSRSFLERTPEIAEALRRALLESEGMQNLFSNERE